jgi:uncharacterized protein YciI
MSQQPPRYLVLFPKGPNWREGVLFNEQPEAGRHGEYMASLRSSGKLIRGVPLADASGSVALFLAQNLEEARLLVEGDPMVQAAVMHADLYDWKVSIPGPD